jgi:exodeoxyribonuclease VII small subunit
LNKELKAMAKKSTSIEGDKDGSKDDGPSFEEDLARLEDIVRKLEGGDMPLEKALALYEEGLGLSKRCSGRLDQAQARIESIMEKDGKLEKSKFDD